MLDYLRRRSTPPTNLMEIIAEVRSRWRAKLVLRGAVRVAAVALALFLASAYALEWAKFSAASIIAARVLMMAALAASFFFFLFKPLRRQVSDEQVALYLEEHEPTLQATLLSAIDASRRGEQPLSPVMVQKLVERAIEACCDSDVTRRIEQAPLRRWSGALIASGAIAVALVLLGPAVLRNALSAILLVSRSVEAAAPYRIDVLPGNASVPKGSDQTITALLHGFDAEDAELMAQRTPQAAFEPLPLVRGEDGKYEGMLFDVAEPLDYFIQADGVRSHVFKLTVVEVPYVQRLEMEYHFPAYTGLEPQKIEDGGDIAVLRGTEVRLRVIPTMKTPSGRVALNDKQSLELTAPAADGSLSASFKVEADGFYRVELQAPTGERVAASPQYTIDVLTDQAPSVSFTKPGRDTTASAIEEVFV